jgi:hypothetical protein
MVTQNFFIEFSPHTLVGCVVPTVLTLLSSFSVLHAPRCGYHIVAPLLRGLNAPCVNRPLAGE